MSDSYIITEYGAIDSSFYSDKLVDVCVDKIGVQTGPFGSQLHNEDYVSIGTPIITVEHLGDNRILHLNDTPRVTDDDKKRLSKYHLQTGDIVFSRVGSVDRRAIVQEEENGWLFSGRCLRVRVDTTKVDPLYLSYFFGLDSFKKYIRSIAVGATMPSINTKILSDLPIYYPSINHQMNIGKILASLDKKIAINQQINQTLEAMAQGLFKSWFVDFEPVKAKIAALEAGKSAEDANIAAMCAISGKTEEELRTLKSTNPDAYTQAYTTAKLFPSALTQSELGMIPEGWKISEIGDEVTVVGGGTPSTKEADFWTNGFIHWTTPKDMSNLTDKVLINTERKITEKGLKKISSGLLPINTVLLSSRAPVGYLAIAKISVAINQGYIAMKCDKTLPPEFVVQWCADSMDEIKQRASGTTFAEISKKNFRNIPVIVPHEKILKEYSLKISVHYDCIANNAEQSQTLTQLRDTLLPKLLSGELSVDAITNAAEVA